jgi:hypothetical protein
MRSKSTVFLLVCGLPLLLVSSSIKPLTAQDAAKVPTIRRFEAFPDGIQASLENRDRARRSLPKTVNGNSVEYVIRLSKRWLPGQTLRVAFVGGDAALRKDIADTANEWSTFGNVKLDFVNSVTGQFREWSTSDKVYVAEIRVSFNQEGYWSLVGTDSVDSAIAKPSVATMNFGGFDTGRPSDWKATVVHEFGHAFGFEHEHQAPVGGCDEDFRWADDPGYIQTTDEYGQLMQDSQGRRPGIYTVLAGPPNGWPKGKVDFNLRQLKESAAFFELGGFDAQSIMKYYFPDWMFTNGEKSHCYSDENLVLSAQDKKGIGLAYPGEIQSVNKLMNLHKGISATLGNKQSDQPQTHQ